MVCASLSLVFFSFLIFLFILEPKPEPEQPEQPEQPEENDPNSIYSNIIQQSLPVGYTETIYSNGSIHNLHANANLLNNSVVNNMSVYEPEYQQIERLRAQLSDELQTRFQEPRLELSSVLNPRHSHHLAPMAAIAAHPQHYLLGNLDMPSLPPNHHPEAINAEQPNEVYYFNTNRRIGLQIEDNSDYAVIDYYHHPNEANNPRHLTFSDISHYENNNHILEHLKQQQQQQQQQLMLQQQRQQQLLLQQQQQQLLQQQQMLQRQQQEQEQANMLANQRLLMGDSSLYHLGNNRFELPVRSNLVAEGNNPRDVFDARFQKQQHHPVANNNTTVPNILPANKFLSTSVLDKNFDLEEATTRAVTGGGGGDVHDHRPIGVRQGLDPNFNLLNIMERNYTKRSRGDAIEV